MHGYNSAICGWVLDIKTTTCSNPAAFQEHDRRRNSPWIGPRSISQLCHWSRSGNCCHERLSCCQRCSNENIGSSISKRAGWRMFLTYNWSSWWAFQNTHSLGVFYILDLFSHSPKAKLLWKEQTGRSVMSYSATRWWSRWEVFHQLLLQFGDIELFLQKHDDLGPASRQKLMAFFQDPEKTALLKIELASIIDWGEAFVKATYNCDGPLIGIHLLRDSSNSCCFHPGGQHSQCQCCCQKSGTCTCSSTATIHIH